MQLIKRRSFIDIDLRQLEADFFLIGDEESGFGIKATEYSDGKLLVSCDVENISVDRYEVLELISIYAENELSPIHLYDAVRDSIIQKLLNVSYKFESFTQTTSAEQILSLMEVDDYSSV